VGAGASDAGLTRFGRTHIFDNIVFADNYKARSGRGKFHAECAPRPTARRAIRVKLEGPDISLSGRQILLKSRN
jgi:hypothetical protein